MAKKGTVKSFSMIRGYGYITPDGALVKEGEAEGDIFVHITEVRKSGLRTLKKGQRVLFDTTRGERSRMAAINIRTLEDISSDAEIDALGDNPEYEDEHLLTANALDDLINFIVRLVHKEEVTRIEMRSAVKHMVLVAYEKGVGVDTLYTKVLQRKPRRGIGLKDMIYEEYEKLRRL